MKFDIRLVAYAPDGDRLGILHHASRTRAALPLNDVPALDLTYTRGMPGAEWLEGFCEVALERNTGADWQEEPNGRFVRTRWSGDHLDATRSIQLSMPGYSFLLSKAGVRGRSGQMDENGKRQFIDATVGEILGTLLSEAKARGCFPGMTWDISDASDSDGEPWERTYNMSFEVGEGLDQVLRSMADQGMIDWNFWGRELHVYNRDTILGRDLTTGDNPVFLRSGHEITSAPDQGDASGLIHRALVRGEDGLLVEVNNPTAISPWGEFEAVIDQGGVSDEGTAILLAEEALREGRREKVQMTRGLIFGAGRWVVLRDYRTGDWIYAPGVDGAKTKARVQQVTLTKDSNGTVEGNLVLQDRFIEYRIKQARQARALTGGAVVGGGDGTKPRPPLPPDVGQDTRTANAPEGFLIGTDAYIDANGNARGLIQAEWAAVTHATDGSEIDIVRYDLYCRPNRPGENWYRLARVDGTITAQSPFDCGSEWQFKVCAVARYAGAGEFSETKTIVIADDEIPPPAPSAPVLSSRLGTVRASWDGETFEGTQMPRDLGHIEVHLGSTGDFTPTPATLFDTLVGERSMTVITDLPYNEDVFVALVAVDRSGNKSEPSEASSIQVQPLVDTDLIGQVIDGANIIDGTLVASEKIIGETITGALIQGLAIEAGHIAANAITADKIEAGAITAEKIQLGAVAPTNLAGAGQNHVTDPGFENEDYWDMALAGETAIDAAAGSWVISSTTARNGGTSMRANLNQTSGDAVAYITPEMPAPSSRQVYVSGYCRAGGGSIAPGPNTEVYISVRVARADGSTSYVSEGLSQLTGSFQKIEGVVDIPANAVSYAVRLFVGNHDSQGAVFFDDACVMDVIGSSDSDHTSIDPSGVRVWSGSSERIRIDAGGFSAWNNDGNKTVEILSSNGRATLTGSFRTGWNPPRIVIDQSGLGNPAIYFQPPGSGDWLTPPNILAWDPDDDNPPAPAVQINSGVQTSSQKNNKFVLHQALGEFWIGNEVQGFPMAYGNGDGSWAFGVNGGDSSDVNRAVVRGRADGTWRIGRSSCFINDQQGTGDLYIGAPGSIFINAALSGGNDGFQVNSDMVVGTSNSPRSFVVNGSKNFVMAHPTRPGMELLHGATESPVSGVEYWGSGELDEGGRAAVELPEYFEGLAKPEGRAVLVTAKGGPVDWSEIDDGWFAVTGSPGQKFTWLVKAERFGADFDIERPARQSPNSENWDGLGGNNNTQEI